MKLCLGSEWTERQPWNVFSVSLSLLSEFVGVFIT